MPFLQKIAFGPLCPLTLDSSEPVLLDVELCSLNGAFIPKGRVGRHYRAISRNGLILLLSPQPLNNYQDSLVQLRMSVWHRASLPGQTPSPWGILLCVRDRHFPPDEKPTQSLLKATLAPARHPSAKIALDLGGERFINFL